MRCSRGLLASVNENSGKLEHSMRVLFDSEEKKDDPEYKMNPEHKAALEMLDAIYMKTAIHMDANKKNLKQPYFNLSTPQATIKPIVYRYLDELTLEPIPTKPSSMYLKAFKVSDTFKTRFEGLDGKTIPWEDLENADFDIIPVVKFRRFFVGAKVSIQHQLVSGIVFNITESVQESAQKETLEKYIQEHPEEVENYIAQITKIRERNALLKKQTDGDTKQPPESETKKNEEKAPENDPEGIAKPEGFGKDIKQITSKAPKRK